MVCLAKETKDENYIPRRDECRTTKTERLASTLNFHMVCEGKDPMTIAGVLSIGQKTFGIRMTLTGEKDGRETEVIQMVVGMRIGECPLMLRATPP
jgi:hypothetical protein